MLVFQDREHLPFVYIWQLAGWLEISNLKLLLLQSNKNHFAGAECVRGQLRIGLPIIAKIIVQVQV